MIQKNESHKTLVILLHTINVVNQDMMKNLQIENRMKTELTKELKQVAGKSVVSMFKICCHIYLEVTEFCNVIVIKTFFIYQGIGFQWISSKLTNS